MADNTNTPKPEQIEALTRAEQILKDQIESTTKVRFKSNEEFRKTIELNTEYYKKLNDIEIALDGQLDLYSEINKKVQDFGKGLTDNIKKAKLQSNTQLSLKGIYSSLNSLQGRLISNQEDLLRGELSSNDVTKDILKNRLLEQNLQKTSKGLNSELNELNNQILTIEEKKQKAGGYLQWSLQQQLNKLNEQKIAIDGLIVGFQNAENAQKDITKELEDQLNTILAIEAHTGVAGKLLKGFSKIPILGDMLDIQGAQKAMNIAAANGTKGFSLLGKGISALGPSLKTALGPLGLILMAADAIKAVFNFYKDMLFRADEQATKLAKTLSVSKETAFGIRREFIGMADSLTTQYNTAESLIDAQSQVSDISKFNFRFSQDILDNQIILTKEIGLSADEATKLNRVNILNNVEGNKGRLLIEKQVVAFTRQTGLYASAKKILQEVSKVSGQILLNFRGNIPALTNAVLQAEKFGLSLEQSRTISDSLLDFESSISNELEAGVFLGRRFNLEQARSLALRKDYVGATEEVLKQVGSIEEFERMSAIHQQVIAKASGMTVDQLSESLMYTQVIGHAQEKNIQKLLKAGDKDLAFRLLRNQADEKEVDAAIRTITAQEKFNIALERAKDIFSTLVTDGTLDSLAEILKSIVDSLSFLINKDKVAKFKVEGAENLVKDIKQQVEEGKIQTTDQQTKALQELAKQKRTIEENIYFGDTFVTLKQGEYRTPTAEQAETIKSGKENLGLIDKINAALEKIQVGNPKPEIIKDGYSDSSDGPFEIKNKYGQTAITAVGDKIAVSPNITKSPLGSSLDLSQMINAINGVKNAIDKTTIAAKNNNLTISPDINIVNQPIKPTIDTNPIPNPNTNFEPIVKPNISAPTLDLTPFINAFTSFKNEVITAMNRPLPTPQFALSVDGRQLGTVVGRQTETGTAQNISTGYTMP